jgi:8-oxo-dGTP pyrophosphatase MutT (NUDIX family)
MAHIHELIDLTVEVFVVNKGRVLLRKHDKYGIWLSVGGHVELNEDPNEAAIREVKEEVGLDIKLVPTYKILNSDIDTYRHLLIPAFMNRHKINENHEHITMVYFAKSNTNIIQQGNNEISKECKWFSIEELDTLKENISETVKSYARTAITTIGSIENE